MVEGDRVLTTFGRAVVRSFDERTNWVFGKPEREMWVVVELLDGPPGRLKFLTPGEVKLDD